MNPWHFWRLFRMILSPKVAVDGAAIQEMGLLAVKIGQMYSVRSDLLDETKCRELSTLLETAEPLETDEFQKRWNELATPELIGKLDTFDSEPFATASLGQVHRGTLDDGTNVAIKIAKTEAKDAFLRDVRMMRFLLRIAVTLYPKLRRLADPMDALDTVERQTLREMNFRTEIEGATRLRTLAEEGADRLPHLRKLRFPGYFPELGHDRLLVSDWIEGRTIARWMDDGDLPYDALLDLFRIHGYFLFVRGEFHGDMHPGNIIWHEERFTFIDNGNIESVPPDFASGLFDMMVAIGSGETRKASGILAGLSLNPLAAENEQGFHQSFAALYQDFAGRTVSEGSLTDQMMRTVKMAVHHGMEFPRGAFPLVKSLMYLDGMVLRVAPDARLLEDVARFAGDFPRGGGEGSG